MEDLGVREMRGLECDGHSISFRDDWDIVCSCGAHLGRDQFAAVVHVHLASLPMTSAEFCAHWKMKRSTSYAYLKRIGAELRPCHVKRKDCRTRMEWYVPDNQTDGPQAEQDGPECPGPKPVIGGTTAE